MCRCIWFFFIMQLCVVWMVMSVHRFIQVSCPCSPCGAPWFPWCTKWNSWHHSHCWFCSLPVRAPLQVSILVCVCVCVCACLWYTNFSSLLGNLCAENVKQLLSGQPAVSEFSTQPTDSSQLGESSADCRMAQCLLCCVVIFSLMMMCTHATPLRTCTYICYW